MKHCEISMRFVFTGLPCCGRHVNTHSEQFEFAYPGQAGQEYWALASRIEARSAGVHALGPQMRLLEPNPDEGVGASAIARKALSDGLDVRAFNAAVGNRTNHGASPASADQKSLLAKQWPTAAFSI